MIQIASQANPIKTTIQSTGQGLSDFLLSAPTVTPIAQCGGELYSVITYFMGLKL